MDVFFVADDFTGGVDVLLQATRCGQQATMFLSQEAFFAAAPEDVRTCTGVATTFRRQPPEEVAGPLGRLLDAALTLQPKVLQYKICSTADSAPGTGSIGPVMSAFEDRGARRVALLVAQPGLRRWTAFSHHFAHDRGTVYRLDRQPTMAHHPVTPMRESDLRLHFADQVEGTVGSLTLEDLAAPEAVVAGWEREVAVGHRLVVLDATTPEHLVLHGQEMLRDAPAFVIGSGGATLGVGLADGWREEASHGIATPGAAGPVLVVVGSCSQLTATQISRVEGRPGWTVLRWDPREDVDPVNARADQALAEGQHVLVHTAGADRAAWSDAATAVPRGLTHIAEATRGRYARLVVAGGDTSGDVLTLMGAVKLTTLSVLDRDTCLCLVTGRGGDSEVVLKGGQIGSTDFFIKAAEGEDAG